MLLPLLLLGLGVSHVPLVCSQQVAPNQTADTIPFELLGGAYTSPTLPDTFQLPGYVLISQPLTAYPCT